MNNLQEFLTKLGACNEAKTWAAKYDNFHAAWYACDRSDWLFWIAGRVGVEQKMIVRAAVAIARTALKYIPEGENRPRICLDTTEQWCDETTTIIQVQNAAACAAANAARAAYAAAAAYAAYAARAAARAADAAAYAARYAAKKQHVTLIHEIIPYSVIHTTAKAYGLKE